MNYFYALLLLFPLWGFGQNLPFPDLVKAVKPAVIKIVHYDYQSYESGGTGFIIDSNGTCVSCHSPHSENGNNFSC